jgi:hypothetical protein
MYPRRLPICSNCHIEVDGIYSLFEEILYPVQKEKTGKDIGKIRPEIAQSG